MPHEPKVGELPALLPCPFCGNGEVQIVEGSTFRWRFACCTECGAQSPEARVQTIGDGTPEEWEAAGRRDALKEWNTRAEREARKDEAIFGRGDLMAVAAFRYCLGRQTYIVGDCVDWLIANWPRLEDNARFVIVRDLAAEFERDDRYRADGKERFRPLGANMDRREWERLRAALQAEQPEGS